MYSSRIAVRSTRAFRVRPTTTFRSTIRHNTNAAPKSSPSSTNPGGFSQALTGGITGGALVFLAGYGYYHFSGAKTIVNTTSAAKKQFQSVTKSLADSAPEPNEALKWLRQTTTSYAAFIPGAKAYVDSAFNDLDKVHEKHADEVDALVKDAYNELKTISKKNGLSLETAQQSWDVLQKYIQKIGELASDSMSDIIDNHPELKEKLGGNIDQLKQMGDKYGPEAKKQVDQTWDQVKDIVKAGVSMDAITKIKKLIEEKTEQMKKLGDEAWQKGMEQAKPYLDKSPKVKELIEKNKDALKQGNFGELYEKIKQSVDSGSTDQLEEYVKSGVDKAKSSTSGGGGGFEKYLSMVPGGDKIVPNFTKLQKIAQEHGDDAEKILKSTVEEIQGVLQKKVGEAQKLADKAQKDAK